jgi:hypothetical protein
MVAAGAKEARMSGIIDKFHVEHGVYGTRVLARSLDITGYCTSEREIDAIIAMLKDDLDTCGREMKRLIELNHRGALFEGWPRGADA